MKKYLILLLVGLVFLNGCGEDNVVTINRDNFEYKVLCSEEDKGVECYDKIQEVCGWSNENINCLVYPCADNYNNECKACSNKDVSYYTQGKCPINEGFYEGKKEERHINIARDYVENIGQYKNYNGKELRIVKIGQAECEGCDFVDVEFFLDSEDRKRTNKLSVKVVVKNLEIVDTEYKQEKV